MGATSLLGGVVAGKQPPDTERGRGVGKQTGKPEGVDCPEGTFHGKIDGIPTKGQTYSFQSDGEAFAITITDIRYEDGEAVCFQFTSEDEIGQVLVKGGPEAVPYAPESFTDGTLEGHWLCAPKNTKNGNREWYQISHVSFCGRPSPAVDYFQLDLVEGEPIQNLDPDNLYDAQDRLVRWTTVGSDGQRTGGSDGPTSEHEAACIDDGPILFDDASNVATVDVEIHQDCPTDLTLSLVGYRLPDGQTTFDRATADQQTFVTADTYLFTPGEGRTLSIDLDA